MFKNSTGCFVLEVSTASRLKIESVIETRREKIKFQKPINWIKHKIWSRQWGFETTNLSFFRFCSEGTNERVWFLKCLQQRLLCSSLFWVFKLLVVNCVYEFPKNYFSNLGEILQNYLKNCLFLSFSSSVVVKIEAFSKNYSLYELDIKTLYKLLLLDIV